MATTAETVMEKTNAVAELFPDYTVYVCDDGAGPYLSIHVPADEEVYSCASLTDEAQCGDDLSKYRWNFWNHQSGDYSDSELGADASLEAVLDFVNENLSVQQEKRESNAG